MNPLVKILAVAAPTLLVGGVLFQSPAGFADNKGGGNSVVVKVKGKDKDKSFSWSTSDDGTGNPVVKVGNLEGIRQMVKARLQGARQAILSAPMPGQVRAKLIARFDRVNAIVDRRLAKIDLSNLGALEDQLDGLGEELEAAMEGLEPELKALALQDRGLRDQLKHLGTLNWNFHSGGGPHGNDADADADADGDDRDADADDGDGWGVPSAPMPPMAPMPPTPPSPPTPPTPPSPPDAYGDVDASAFDGLDLKLRPEQRAALRAARAEADAQISPAHETLDRLSGQLTKVLRNPSAPSSQVNALVDQISAQEATIRKAKIGAWLKSRSALDAAQRKQLEAHP
jgi:Spy/CpxP family protein refolding chaperone